MGPFKPLAKQAIDLGLVSCHNCYQLSDYKNSLCSHCGHSIASRKRHSLQYTIALLVTSIILYIPANVLPIMYTSTFGNSEENTIFSGVAIFWKYGDYPIAIIIFVASVLIPMAKMLALAWLCAIVLLKKKQKPYEHVILYRVTEWVGRWSMVDVFVVVILVTLIQLGNILSITPGIAAIAFAGVVVCTMLAALSFDPRLIWDTAD